MSKAKTLVCLNAFGGKGIINDIEICGHSDEATCAVLSTISSYLETSLDNFGVPYSIQCEPLAGTRRISTQSGDEVAWRLFQIAADMFRAATICEPTRGKVEVSEPIDWGIRKSEKDEEEH